MILLYLFGGILIFFAISAVALMISATPMNREYDRQMNECLKNSSNKAKNN